MKKVILPIILLCITQLAHADDSADFFDGIIGEFFQPYSDANMTKIEGGFDWRRVEESERRENSLPFSEMRFFYPPENDKYGIKYFAHTDRTDGGSGSMIEIYGQQFSLGFSEDEVDGWPREIMPSSVEFWLVNYAGKTFLSLTAYQAGANAWYAAHVLLFDITDRENVRFRIFDTVTFTGYKPQLYMHGGRLFILISDTRDYYGNWHARFYLLDNFEELANNNGKEAQFIFSYDKWGGESRFQYLGSNFPNRFQK